MNRLIRTIHPEVKIIDKAKGIVDYVASDETLDHYKEIIRANGWRFTHFKKNSPFVDSHDYSTVGNLLGKVIDFKVAGKQLVERVKWAIDSDSDLARLGFSLTAGGYLKAVSVGFIPKKIVSKWDTDQSGFKNAIAEMGIAPENAASLRSIYLEQEQIELSACILGANPSALSKAHIDGFVTDETLGKLGFDDDGLQFLHKSAAVYDEATPEQRAFITLAIRAITTFRKGNQMHRAASHDNGAADEAAIQRQRKWFLAELNRHTEVRPRAASSNKGADDEAAIQRRRPRFPGELKQPKDGFQKAVLASFESLQAKQTSQRIEIDRLKRGLGELATKLSHRRSR